MPFYKQSLKDLTAYYCLLLLMFLLQHVCNINILFYNDSKRDLSRTYNTISM